MWTGRSRRQRHAVLAGPLLAALALPVAAGAPRIDGRLEVAELGLPAKGAGMRELRHAFGRDLGAELLRDAAIAALADRDTFAAVGREPGDLRLELILQRLSARFERMEGFESTDSALRVRASVAHRWTGPDGLLHEGVLELTESVSILDRPRRDDSGRAWLKLLDAAAARAFADAFESGTLGRAPRPDGWIGDG